MSPRKIAPIAGGALLLTVLLLLYFSRTLDWNWNAQIGIDNQSQMVAVSNQRLSYESAQLNVNVSLSKEDFAQLHEYNARFMGKYPHIEVNLTNEEPSPDLFVRWSERSESGMGPDIMLMENGWVVPFAVKGYLKSVDGLISGDALADQLSGLTEPLRWNGYLWAVPKNIDPHMLFWNKDLLDGASIAKLPNDEATLREAAAAVAAIQGDEQLYLVNFSPGELQQPLMWLSKFYGDPGVLINLQGMTDKQRDGLEWLQSIHSFVSGIAGTRYLQLSQEIENDKQLSLILSWEQYSKLTQAAREKLTPDEDMFFSWLGGSSFAISSRSRAEKEAMLWIEEITGTASGRLALEYSGKLPVRASLYGEAGRLLSRSRPSPPLWWYEAMSAKPPERDMIRPDKEWPIRWQQWERRWESLSFDDVELDAGEWVAALTGAGAPMQ